MSIMASRTNRFFPVVVQAPSDWAKRGAAGRKTASAARSAVRRSARLTAPAYKEKARFTTKRALKVNGRSAEGASWPALGAAPAAPAGNNSRQRPTLPRTYARSTIGGGRLNFRVRNGNGCDPAPMTTGKLVGLGAQAP